MIITYMCYGLSLFLNYPCILFQILLRIIKNIPYIK
jgi:hypothetical protein